MSELSIPERVAAGAAWLDENQPGWMSRIFLEKLDLSSCALCVLGQVYGHYDDAPDEAKYDADDDLDCVPAKERGFERSGMRFGEYVELTAEWRRLIESRRAATDGWYDDCNGGAVS